MVMPDMDDVLLSRLVERDTIESRFRELFQDLRDKSSGDAGLELILINNLKKELLDRNTEIRNLQEIVAIQKRNSNQVNDELLSLNIENNLLHNKLDTLTEEHEKLVKRWLDKIQKEADSMNETLK